MNKAVCNNISPEQDIKKKTTTSLSLKRKDTKFSNQYTN